MERQLRMGGGIMNAMPRQQYGLGSFVKKAVKGVTGAVKKIAGSDLGKAALGIGLGMYAGGLGPFAQGSTMFGGKLAGLKGAGFLKNLPAITGEGGILKGITENFPGGGMGLAATAAGLTGFLSAQGKNEEEIEEIKQNPEVLGGYLEQYYRNLNPPTADTNSQEYEAQVSDFVQRNLKADGGRMGFAGGKSGQFLTMEEAAKRDPAMFVDTTTSAYGDAGKGRPVPDFLKPQKTLKENLQFLNEIKGGMSPKSTAYMLKEYLDNALKNKQITKEKYNEMLMPFFGKTGERVTKQIEAYENFANGGRIGFEGGGYTFEDFLKDKQQVDQAMSMEELRREYERMMKLKNIRDTRDIAAYGGRIGYAFGNQPEQNAMQASGIGGLPLNQNPAGITELDLRDNGGFIPPVGVKEKADDIPAMLSNNEFVFTADAVRGMGDGDVNVGAQRMYDMMKKLEGGGRV